MLTEKQKKFLEEQIFQIALKKLNEEEENNGWADKNTKQSSRRRKKDLALKTKEETVYKELDDPTVNKAQIAYAIDNATTEDEKAASRSIFYKKLHRRKNDNGSPYKFSETELNKIANELRK